MKELTELMRFTRSSAKMLNDGKGIPLWLTPWAVKGTGRGPPMKMADLRLRVQLLRSMMARPWARRGGWKPLMSDVESLLQLLMGLADRRDKEAASQSATRAAPTPRRVPELTAKTDTIEVSHKIDARYRELSGMILKLQDFGFKLVTTQLVDNSAATPAANSNARRQYRHRFRREVRLGCRALHVSYDPGA